MADSKEQQTCEGMTITLEQDLWIQLSKDRRTDILEDLIRHFENQTQYYNDLLLSDARQAIYTTNTKDNTNTTGLQIDRAVDNKINGKLTNPSKKGNSKTDTMYINTVMQTFECNTAE